jgi:hypothetical protein
LPRSSIGLINAAFAPAGATLLELRALHRKSELTCQ